MPYVSLYRKYRPQKFADVMGQGHVTRTLQNAIEAGHIAHGYLFTGTRGTAKTTVARLLAKALNCDRGPAPEPCNACDACTAITDGACIDVVEMDAASHRGVADIEEVRKAVGYGPMQFRYKVFIIDEAHQLSSDAKDAFLKTLEEPPDNVVFILATTEPQSIPITIRSRCQQFDFKRGSLQDIAARLGYVLHHEGVAYTADAVNLVARNAEGSWRDALSLLEQVLAFSGKTLSAADVDMVLGTLDNEMLARVTDAIARRDAPAAFALAGELLDAGKEARTLLKALSSHFRDLLLVSVGGPAAASELTPEEVGSLQEQARQFAPARLLRAIEILNEAQGETRWNNQHRLLVELAFLKLMHGGDAPGENAVWATAPIVFPTASVVAAPAPAIQSVPSTPPPPVAAPPSSPVAQPPAPPVHEPAEEPEALPAGYFAADDEDDEDDAADEDTYVPDEDASEIAGIADIADVSAAPMAAVPEPLVAVSPESEEPEDAEETEPEDTGPSLFDDPATPARASTISDAADASQEVAAVLAPGLAPRASHASGAQAAAPQPDEPLPTAPLDGISLEQVRRIWHQFLRDAEQHSKRAAVMMETAQPTACTGKMVTITFRNRANHDMMSTPRSVDFVRKVLARCLGVDSVQIKFALDADAPPLSPPRAQPRPEPSRTDGAWTRTPPPAYEAPPAATVPPPPAASVAPSAFAPAAAASGRFNNGEGTAPRRNAVPEVAASVSSGATEAAGDPNAAALEDPLVQETLSIFGGEIVND